jgi:hypothetical protein
LTGNRSNTVIKVPLSSTEYYLIENRQFVPFKTDYYEVTTEDNVYSYPVYDTVHSSVMFMLWDSLCADDKCEHIIYNSNKTKGIITNTSSFDIGLPGFGVCIWHVDEKVINQKMEYNGINNNINRRGVDLEEADGIEDIGVELSNLISTIYLYGGPEDFFPHKDFKKNQYVNKLTPYNYHPEGSNTDRFFSTHTNTGGYTGITIEVDTFPSASKMHEYANTSAWQMGLLEKIGVFAADSFKIIVKWALSQGFWPQPIGSFSGPKNLASIDSTIYTISNSGVIIGFSHDGDTGRAFSDSTLHARGYRNPGTPSVSGKSLVFVSDTLGTSGRRFLHRFNTADTTDTLLAVLSGQSVTTSVSAIGDTFFLGTSAGRLFKIAAGVRDSLTLPPGKSVSAIACDTQRLYAVCGNAVFKVSRASWSVTASQTLPALNAGRIKMAVGDIAQNRQGLEIVMNDTRGNVVLLDSGLTMLTGWPVKIEASGAVPPALGDVDGDRLLDIVIPGKNKIYALNYTGTHLTRWPHIVAKRDSTPDGPASVGQFTAAASLSDIDGNGDMEVFVPAPNGNLMILDGDARAFEFTAGAKVMDRKLSFGGLPGPSCLVKNIDTDSAAGVSEHIEIFVQNTEGWVSGFNIRLSGRESTAWSTEGGGLSRTFVYAGPLLPYSEDAGDIGIDTLFTYPNPTRTGNLVVKYKLSKSARKVRLKLFNAAGDLVMKKDNLPGSALWSHYPVSLKKIAPGMYMLKLEAQARGGSAFKFTKVGILK